MTPAEAKDWLGVAALLISVSGAFYAWLTRGSKDNSEQIGKLDSRMDDMSTRLQSVEHELKHMPDRETISDLRVSVEGLKAGLNAMGSQTQTMAASVRRIEDYLLKAPEMTDFSEHLARSARLIILRALAAETSRTLNEVVLQGALETFGINRHRGYVRTQINVLADLGAVQLRQAGSVLIAVLTQTGLDHVESRTVIDGVDRPSLGA